MLIAALLIAATQAEEPAITVRAYPWAPFISPMGEPFRSRTQAESPISRWFAQADRNRDGLLTDEEMQSDSERFFARLDSNHDSRIDPQEIRTYEWEIAPDVQVNSDWKRPRGQIARTDETADKPAQSNERRRPEWQNGYRLNGLQGAARYGLLNLPQPVASADADLNRLVTLAEFREAASARFGLLDTTRQGSITLAALEMRLPERPTGKREKQRRKEKPDSRVGQPLPTGQ
jgi:hypothetical protein